MRSLTERGLRWVVVSLAIALGANLVALGVFLAITGGQGLDFGTRALGLDVGEVLLFASVVPGFLGFWRTRQGKREFASAHEANITWAGLAFVLGAVSALVYLATGLTLGFVFVPATGLGSTLRAAHQIAPNLLVVWVGLFLLGTIWQLGTKASRSIAAGAFLSAILAMFLGILTLVVPLPTGAWDIALALPVVSVGLWLAAYLLVTARLRSLSFLPPASPATT